MRKASKVFMSAAMTVALMVACAPAYANVRVSEAQVMAAQAQPRKNACPSWFEWFCGSWV